MMKNFILFISLLILVSGCRKEEFKRGFEINYLVDIEVDAGLSPLLSHSYTIQNLFTGIEAKATANGYTLADFTKINAKFLRMDMITPSAGDYKFLERIYLELSTTELGPAEIGYLEFIPNDQNGTINFIPSQTDVQDYLTLDYVDLVLRIDPIAPPPYTTINKLDLTFHVTTEK